jgi:hypothetical protein
MFGLRNKKVFKVKNQRTNGPNPRSIIYDDWFIIWGYEDLKIRYDYTDVYSRYGTSVSSYEEVGNSNPSIEDLFQCADRETALVDYEIFAIEFED